jgi:small ligand-binding sensory domain FIST
VNTDHSSVAHWPGDFDEAGLQAWAEKLRRSLRAPYVSLGLVFMTPKFFPHARQVLEILRVHAQIPLLAGCSSTGLIVDNQEMEENGGLTLGLYSLPGAKLEALHFNQEHIDRADGPDFWPGKTGIAPGETNGWLVFLDPFHADSEAWLQSWNAAYAPLPVLGGLASGIFNDQTTQVYLNGDVLEESGVAISVGGDVKLASVIAQGCMPIGETWTLTSVENNLIHKIANRRAYDVLADTFNALPADEQQKTRGNLFIGLAMNEYLEDFHRGDFLIRNLLGADPKTGVVAVGAYPRAGQTIQFQRRDAAAANEDMCELLARAKSNLQGATVFGGCLCCCNGRGHHLFGSPSHDAGMVQQQLGPFGMTGFFCNGEIGPVGERNFLHGYTASLALFVKK